MTRLTSRSDGQGRPVSAAVSSWAAGNPKVRRVWLSAAPDESIALMVELQPVGDSEETLAVWMTHCNDWKAELQAEIGAPVGIEWYDPDSETPGPGAGTPAKTLIYERAR